MEQDRLNTLDLNKIQRDSFRFSFKKVEKQIQVLVFFSKQIYKNEEKDIYFWASAIQEYQEGNFEYPAQKEKAIIHQQSCYLRPDDEFLNNNPGVNECTCCGRKIRRIRADYWRGDLYEIFVPTEGLVWPLYFTFLKTHFILLLLIQCLIGFYFMYQSLQLCSTKFEYDELDGDPCDATIVGLYYFIPQDYFLANLLTQDQESYETYLLLAILVYTIIMITPFIHEIVMRAKQIKYWQYDPWNMIKFDKLALYIKHLPFKMTCPEIQQSIYQVIQKKDPNSKYLKLFDQDEQAIDELVYIYDTHILMGLNQRRQQIFLDLLKTTGKISDIVKEQELQESQASQQELPEIQTLRKQFRLEVQELMILTKQINIYLEQGLPFTKKIILKLKTVEQAQAVYRYFKRSTFNQIYLKAQVLWQARNEIKEETQRQNDLQEKLYHSAITDSSVVSRSASIQDLAQIFKRSKSMSIHESVEFINSSESNDPKPLPANQRKTISKSFMEQKNSFMDYVDKNEFIQMQASMRLKKIQEYQIKQLEDEDKKSLHIQRGFREDDILWENIGMHTLRRFLLRIVSLLVSIIASVICMGIFQYLFIWSKKESYNIANGQTSTLLVNITLNLIPLIIVTLSVLASVIVQVTTMKARRSTYTQQEMNIINFLSFTQLLLVLSTPYILVLSFWHGLYQALSIKTLILLGRMRIAFKGIAHILHFRSCSYYFKRRKILKNFDGRNYFQKQVNQLLTPGLFPIRSRLLYAFFILSTGYLMIFLAPYLLMFCLGFQFFFYFFDRYTLFRVFAIDKQFTFNLMRYLVTAYQIIMTPIYTYVFYEVFRERTLTLIVDQIKTVQTIGSINLEIFGISLGVISWITYILFRQPIADFFVFKIFRIRKPEGNQQSWEKTYFQSYQDYYQVKLKAQGVDELTTTLVNIFQNLQMEKRSRK